MTDEATPKHIDDLHRLRAEGVITEEEFAKAQRAGSSPTLWQRLWWNPNPTRAARLTPRPARQAPSKRSSADADAFYGSFFRSTVRILQWLVVAVALIVGLNVLFDYDRIHLPGASPELFWGSLATAATCALVLAPPVFFRLPGNAKVAPYALLIAFFVVANWETTVAVEAYARTPEGAKEAAVNAQRDKVEAAKQAERDRVAAAEQAEHDKTEQLLADAANTEKQLTDYHDKAERCFSSWGHRLPALESPVKESLQNPHAFEHVKTELIVPDSDHNNVMMTFRAQNGFAAIRTVHVLAQLSPDDCSVQNIGPPQED